MKLRLFIALVLFIACSSCVVAPPYYNEPY